MATFESDEIEAPEFYAAYYFNGDADYLTPEEIADADAIMDGWQVDCIDTERGTFYGQHNGLLTQMWTYVVRRQK